jgi:hypothetical protein
VLLLLVATAAVVGRSASAPTGNPPAPSVPEDPEQPRRAPLEAIYRELDSGAFTTLVNERGQERWYRWATEKDRPALEPPLFGYRTIKAVDRPCQCELLPDPRSDGYLFTADVQLGQRLLMGRAGAYFLAEEISTPAGRLYRYLTLHVATQRGKEAVLHCCLEHYREPQAKRAGPPDRSYLVSRVYPLAWLEKWHTLQAEVSVQGVTLRCDGAVLKVFPQARLDQRIHSAERQLPAGALPPLKRRGSLGLFVSDGSADFRNVVVKPLVRP